MTVLNMGEEFTLRYPSGKLIEVTIEPGVFFGPYIVAAQPKTVTRPAAGAPVFLAPKYHAQAVEYARFSEADIPDLPPFTD